MKNFSHNRFLKRAASYDEDRHWEVNSPRYDKKEGEVSEHDFMNRNRFLAGRNQHLDQESKERLSLLNKK